MKINSLLAATLSLVLVAGLGIPAYAGGPPVTSCTISPDMVSVQLGPNDSVDIEKTITCDEDIIDVSFDNENCQLNQVDIPNIVGFFTPVVTLTEKIQNLGDDSEEHCTVGWTVFGDTGSGVEVTQTIWINEREEIVVGGEFLPIDSTALVLAGLQTSAIWMLPVLAGVAGSAFGILYIKSRRN